MRCRRRSTISSPTPSGASSTSSAWRRPKSSAGKASKEVPKSLVEFLGLLDVGDVGGLRNIHELRARQMLADVLRSRRRGVRFAGDGKHRQLDVLQTAGGVQ